VLENDLFGAFHKADDVNRYRLYEICKYIWNELPGICWGSKEAVKKWLGES